MSYPTLTSLFILAITVKYTVPLNEGQLCAIYSLRNADRAQFDSLHALALSRIELGYSPFPFATP